MLRGPYRKTIDVFRLPHCSTRAGRLGSDISDNIEARHTLRDKRHSPIIVYQTRIVSSSPHIGHATTTRDFEVHAVSKTMFGRESERLSLNFLQKCRRTARKPLQLRYIIPWKPASPAYDTGTLSDIQLTKCTNKPSSFNIHVIEIRAI